MSTALESRLQGLAKTDDSMFIPKKLVPVKVDGKTIMAYEEIDSNTPPAERLYALMCNKSAAENAMMTPQQVINFYASRCNLEANARAATAQWTSRLTNKWDNPNELEVLSYHDHQGALIPNAIDPATGALRPITDGDPATRRPASVRFAQVRLRIDYQDIHHDNAPCTVDLTYFIPLPCGNVTFLDAGGAVIDRITCTIDGDPFALTVDEFRAQVLVPGGVAGPCGLMPSPLGVNEATIDTDVKVKQLHFRIISAARETIFLRLREQLAPGYSATPFATCEKITMAFQDGSGNSVELTVLEFFNALLQGAVAFLEQDHFPYNLANHFANNLAPQLKESFSRKTRAHLTFSDLNRDAQMKQLDTYLAVAIDCERELSNTKSIVRSTLGDTHAFVARLLHQTTGDRSLLNTNYTDTDTFLSAAEATLARYGKRKGETGGGSPRPCWGCLKTDHRWMDKKTKEILCPNKDQPGVAARAAASHKKYLEDVKERKNGWIQKKKIKFENMTATQKEACRQFVLQEARDLANLRQTGGGDSHGGGQATLSFLSIPMNLESAYGCTFVTDYEERKMDVDSDDSSCGSPSSLCFGAASGSSGDDSDAFSDKEAGVDMKMLWGCNSVDNLWKPCRSPDAESASRDLSGEESAASAMEIAHHDQAMTPLDEITRRNDDWMDFSHPYVDDASIFHHVVPETIRSNQDVAILDQGDAPMARDFSGMSLGGFRCNYFTVPLTLHSRHNCTQPLLPATIDGQLPHIVLRLGHSEMSMESCPEIRALYDTGASMSSGYAGFWLPILRAHPEIVDELYTSENGEYNPIILGGIVTGDDGAMENHSTKLTLVANIRLRYSTHQNQPISHKIAIGPNVGVNTIVGKPFIKALQCIYDAFCGVVEAKLLDSPPFKVIEMYPQRYDTNDKVGPSSTNSTYSAIVAQLDKISAIFAAQEKGDALIDAPTSPKSKKSVTFDETSQGKEAYAGIMTGFHARKFKRAKVKLTESVLADEDCDLDVDKDE